MTGSDHQPEDFCRIISLEERTSLLEQLDGQYQVRLQMPYKYSLLADLQLRLYKTELLNNFRLAPFA